MLVCAPSNAVTDELLQRVLDGEMKVYCPAVARVGVVLIKSCCTGRNLGGAEQNFSWERREEAFGRFLQLQ
ncbi:hypothetical protein KI387_044359, partial [Taxus chinensis]